MKQIKNSSNAYQSYGDLIDWKVHWFHYNETYSFHCLLVMKRWMCHRLCAHSMINVSINCQGKQISKPIGMTLPSLAAIAFYLYHISTFLDAVTYLLTSMIQFHPHDRCTSIQLRTCMYVAWKYLFIFNALSLLLLYQVTQMLLYLRSNIGAIILNLLYLYHCIFTSKCHDNMFPSQCQCG